MGLKRGAPRSSASPNPISAQVADGMSPIDLMAQGIAPRARRLRPRADATSTGCSAPPRRAAPRAWRWPSISASRPPSSTRRSSAARPSSFMSRTPWRRCSSGCARSRSSPMAARSAASAAGRPRCARYNPYETPFRPFLPSTAYALAASRHMHQFGTTREQLAAVAVAARRMGAAQPGGLGKEAADDRRGAVARG